MGFGSFDRPPKVGWEDGKTRKSRFTEEQIAMALRQGEAATTRGTG